MNKRKVFRKLSALLTMAMLVTSPGASVMAAETSAEPEAVAAETDQGTEILTDEDYLVDPDTGFAYTVGYTDATIIGYFGDDPLVNPVIPTYVHDDAGNTYQVFIVEEDAFRDNTKLVGCLEINSKVRISKNAFYGCTGLTGLYLGEDVDQETAGIINQYAFEGCSGIKKVVSHYLAGIYINDMGSGKTWVDPDTGDEYGPHDKLMGGTAVWKDEVFDEYTVSFVMNGAAEIASKTVKWMDELAVPKTPKRDRYDFQGWFLDEQCTIQYSSAAPVLSDITLYAKWMSRAGGEGGYLDKDTDYAFMVSEDNTAIIIGYMGRRDADIDLGDLNIPGTVTESESGDVYTVTAIGDGAFENDRRFTGTLTIPGSVTSIGARAFKNCTKITGNLTIPDSVTSVGDSAFYDCIGLNGTLTISDSLTGIEDWTFYNCYSLIGSLTIPDSVTYVGMSAFCSCIALNGTLTIGKNVTAIGNGAFTGCRGLYGDIVIPDKVRTIGTDAFSMCEGFDGTVTFGKSLESIGAGAFKSLGIKGGLKFPGTLQSIGEEAFSKCKHLDGELVLSRNLTYIGKEAFWYCENLTGNIILISRAKELTVGANAFEHCDWLGPTLALDSYVDWNNDSSFFYQSFMYCGGLKRVINRTNKELYLPALKAEKAEGHTWKDASNPTGSAIFSITNGTAIRDDYDPSKDIADPWKDDPAGDDTYSITMMDGSAAFVGDDEYSSDSAKAGDRITIQWLYEGEDKEFVRWETQNKGVTLADPYNWETTFVMPAENVTITYVEKKKGEPDPDPNPDPEHKVGVNVVVKQKVDLSTKQYFGVSFDRTDKWKVEPKGSGSVSKGIFTAKKAGKVTVTRMDSHKTVLGTIEFTIEAPVIDYPVNPKNGRKLTAKTFYRINEEIDVSALISTASGLEPVKYECSDKNGIKYAFNDKTATLTVLKTGSCKINVYYNCGDNARYAAKYTINIKSVLPKLAANKKIKSGKSAAVAITKVQPGTKVSWKLGVPGEQEGEWNVTSDFEIAEVTETANGSKCKVNAKGDKGAEAVLIAQVGEEDDFDTYTCSLTIK